MIEFIDLIISTLEPIDSYSEFEFKNYGLLDSYIYVIGFLQSLSPKIFYYHKIQKIFSILINFLNSILRFSNSYSLLIKNIIEFFFSYCKENSNFNHFFKNEKYIFK
jgi:hypothetical protein